MSLRRRAVLGPRSIRTSRLPSQAPSAPTSPTLRCGSRRRTRPDPGTDITLALLLQGLRKRAADESPQFSGTFVSKVAGPFGTFVLATGAFVWGSSVRARQRPAPGSETRRARRAERQSEHDDPLAPTSILACDCPVACTWAMETSLTPAAPESVATSDTAGSFLHLLTPSTPPTPPPSKPRSVATNRPGIPLAPRYSVSKLLRLFDSLGCLIFRETSSEQFTAIIG